MKKEEQIKELNRRIEYHLERYKAMEASANELKRQLDEAETKIKRYTKSSTSDNIGYFIAILFTGGFAWLFKCVLSKAIKDGNK